MDSFTSSSAIFSVVSIAVALLWAKSEITTSLASVLILALFVIGNVGLKLSKALISPYISPLRHIPGPSV
jgi:hypothetical protein